MLSASSRTTDHPQTTRGAGSARAQALRRARAASAAAAAERAARHKRVEAALAQYFESASVAGRIRDTARARADKVLAAAEEAAAEHDAAACAAIARLRELGQVNAQISGLCGISVTAVRAMAGRGRAAVAENAGAADGAGGGDAG